MCDEIEFVNRNYELDEICRPGGPKFVLVDAPAGYGKTFLLERVKEIFEARNDWVTVLVRLKSRQDIASDRVEQARATIANEVANQMGERPIASPGMDENQVLFAICAAIPRETQKLLLLFDAIEVLSPDTSNWLRNMIGGVDNALWNEGKELRVVLAGRYVRDWGKGAQFGLRVLRLSPFGPAVIQPIVRDALERGNLGIQRISQAVIEALATYTQWISGGHPKAICGIAAEIERLPVVPPNLWFFFFEFSPRGDGQTMFDLYMEPIIEAILGGLDVRDALETISIFRKFNPDVLDILIKGGEFPGEKTGLELMQKLMNTHLVDTPNLANPMYSDDIVRRMLAIRMRITSPDRYRRLNERARAIFHTWAQGKGLEGIPENDKLDTHIKLVSIVETLYHTLSLSPHAVGLPNGPRVDVEISNEKKIADEIKQYATKFKDPVTVQRLKAALTGDQELLELIYSRAGWRGFNHLLKVVDSFITAEVDGAFDEGGLQPPPQSSG